MVNAPGRLGRAARPSLVRGFCLSTDECSSSSNLSGGQIVHAGINDWGGVSLVTPDFVVPVHVLGRLTRETAAAEALTERLTVYLHTPDPEQWTPPTTSAQTRSTAKARIDERCLAIQTLRHQLVMNAIINPPRHVSQDIHQAIQQATKGEALSEQQIVRLFSARGDDFSAVVQSADQLRRKTNGDSVSFVVNRNINYTNICYFKCQFCAFSKGKLSENLRGRPYDLSDEEIRAALSKLGNAGPPKSAAQGGIHPEYTGDTYVHIVE